MITGFEAMTEGTVKPRWSLDWLCERIEQVRDFPLRVSAVSARDFEETRLTIHFSTLARPSHVHCLRATSKLMNCAIFKCWTQQLLGDFRVPIDYTVAPWLHPQSAFSS